MASTIRAFTTFEELLKIREQWNELVHRQCVNPYFLSGFIEQFCQSRVKEGGKPLFLAYFVGQRIVGIAPLVVFSWKGLIRVASFLTSPDFDPDFVVLEEQRKAFLYKTVDFLFNKVGCNLVDLSLPSETETWGDLVRASELLGINHMIFPIAGHSVIPVEKSWNEFQEERGRNFRKFFRSVERKMGLVGTWKVELATKGNSETEIYNGIQKIEKASWKHEYRTQVGLKTDQSLLDLWAGASASSFENDFRWQVAFLEINGKRIAYCFWLEYKDNGFVCKTSFDDRYRKYYPGIYINNVAVRELFNDPTIKQIDFMTDLPFQSRWMPKLIPRFRFTMAKSPILIGFVKTLNNRYYWIIRYTISRNPSNRYYWIIRRISELLSAF